MNKLTTKDKVQIHPASIRYLKSGHPHITLDNFSKRFPKNSDLIYTEINGVKFILLNDPSHKRIKARLWDKAQSIDKYNFKEELRKRIAESFEKRRVIVESHERENILLIHGEVDLIPGLNFLKLKDQYLITTYSFFWKKIKKEIYSILREQYSRVFGQEIEAKSIWYQERLINQEAIPSNPKHTLPFEFSLSEYQTKYKIKLGLYQDFGIYTDMAPIRKKLKKHFESSKSLLNLFCYTGAFSIFAHNLNKELYSTNVDLSSNYLSWLDENIEINNFDSSYFINIKSEALKFLKKNHTTYDFIICDPPSSSSAGKRASHFEKYEEYLPLLEKALNVKGHLLIVLNTHKITPKKFQNKVEAIIANNSLRLKVSEKFYNSEDYYHAKFFPESSYLKCLLLRKN